MGDETNKIIAVVIDNTLKNKAIREDCLTCMKKDKLKKYLNIPIRYEKRGIATN
jgi:hypothetical protein